VRTAALTFILMLLSQGCSAQTGLYLIALMGPVQYGGARRAVRASGRLSRKSHEALELSAMPINGSLPRSPSIRPKARWTSFRSAGAVA
jgi:hypothetical protein